jgi:uncharacterized repeat protein (TIGR03803 family)
MTFKLFSISRRPRVLTIAFIFLLMAPFTPGAQGQSHPVDPTRDPNCPPLQGGFMDIFDFAPQIQNGGAASNLAIDRAGNFYGSLAAGGNHSQGLLYKLAQHDQDWLFDPLFNFAGGNGGGDPSNVIFSSSGVLYGGAATGGIQACGNNGNSYCGVIYSSRPGPTICGTGLCGWMETTLYQFSGNTDAWGGTVSAIDQAGNLYGISLNGGANGQGAVFELSPTQRGWTEQVLYSFTGGSDGAQPSSLLVGHDGNLYGTAFNGGIRFGVVFQLVPSGGSWTENVLYTFPALDRAFRPGSILQDSAGNLYGYAEWTITGVMLSVVWELSPSDGGWQYSQLLDKLYRPDCNGNTYPRALTLASSGHLYLSCGGVDSDCMPHDSGDIYDVTAQTFVVEGNVDIFQNMTADANGNLYGASAACGNNGGGMVWKLTP